MDTSINICHRKKTATNRDLNKVTFINIGRREVGMATGTGLAGMLDVWMGVGKLSTNGFPC